MADPQTRRVSYSGLPVFSGTDVLSVPAQGELTAPRMSGIPLLVSQGPPRRHYSAQASQGHAMGEAAWPMPKSQSLRDISLRRLPAQASGPAKPHNGAQTSLNTSRLRPRQSPTSKSTLKAPVPAVTRSISQSRLSPGTTASAPQVAASAAAPVAAAASRRRVPSSASPVVTAASSERKVPSYAMATTAASAAKKIVRSESGKSITRRPGATRTSEDRLQLSKTTSGNSGTTSRSPATGATAGTTSTPVKSRPFRRLGALVRGQASAKAPPSTQTSHSAAQTTSASQATPTAPAAQVSRAPIQPTGQARTQARLPVQPALAAQVPARAQPSAGRKTTRAPIGPPTGMHPPATRPFEAAPPVALASTAAPRHSSSSFHYQHDNGSGTLPLPRRQQTMPEPSMAHSTSIPNLSSEGTRGRLRNKLFRVPRSAECSSERSSKSSSRSISEATQRFFVRIRSRASSRSSISSVAPPPPVVDSDNWEDLEVEKLPSEAMRIELTSLSTGSFMAGSSQRPDKSLIKQGAPGLVVARTAPVLTTLEQAEIINYKTVYFCGKEDVTKLTANFTDKQGNYRHVLHDHIAYRYEILAELGKGSFGKVFQCRDHKTGRLVAVKVTCNRPEMRRQARVEAQLLQNLGKAGNPDKHHFLRYLGSFGFRDHFCITSEILGSNLYEMLKRTKFTGLDLGLVRYITRQLVEGLEFLDLQGVIHCDLKPENILVSDQDTCQVKIIDFGSGCYETNRVYTYIQSRFYRAPEILLGVPYSTAIDMWSLGCIVPELIIGKPLFPGEDEADQVACLCQTLGSPDKFMLKSCSRGNLFFDARGNPLSRRSGDGIVRGPPGSRGLDKLLPPVAADFVSKLLQWSPHKRLSAGGALFHEFVLGV